MNKRVESAMTHRERIPYQLPQPAHMRPDQVVLSANPAPDDRHWVPLNEGIWLRPLQFNVSLPDDCKEMITMFQVNGSLIYVDPHGKTLGYDDVFTRLERAREHFKSVGLGADYVERFVR